ncbi:MAG: hypothetical protein ACP5HC_03420 [Caldisericum sp.]
MVNFSFKIESKSQYDFLCGRVKVLETYLMGDSVFKELVKKDFKGFVEVLQNYPYKNFLEDVDFESVKKAIENRKKSEFDEISKFDLKDFIDVFFKSKEYFLLLKKIALGDVAFNNGFTDLLLKSPCKVPLELCKCFEELKAGLPSYIRPLVIDVYYLNFIWENAKKTNSDFIVEFYSEFINNTVLKILMRNYNFVKNNFINENDFNKLVEYLYARLEKRDILTKVRNFEELSHFLNYSRAFYSEKELDETYETLEIDTLRRFFDKGKYFNEGIEPIFVYLLRLDYEASLLQKLAYALYHGVSPTEIPELEFAYE